MTDSERAARDDPAIKHSRRCDECGARTYAWERCHECGDRHWIESEP